MVCIAVLQPGAGYTLNRNMYTHLEREGHIIRLIGNTKDIKYQGYDKYPRTWEDDIKTWDRNERNLCTLAHELIEDEALNNIDILICGSRGGQVTLHELWNLGWRGRTINLNASAIVPPRDIPANAALVLVSFGADYFPTRDPTYVQELCKKYLGIIDHFHANEEAHVPSKGQLITAISEIVRVTMSHPNPNPNPMQCRGTDTHTRERREMKRDIFDTVLGMSDEEEYNKAASEARMLLDEQDGQELELRGKQRVRSPCHWQSALNSIDKESNIRKQLKEKPYCSKASEWQKIDKAASEARMLLDEQDGQELRGKQRVRSPCHWQSALNSIDKESNIRKQLKEKPYCLKASEWQKIDNVLSRGMEECEECEDGKQKLRNILQERQCFVPLDPSTTPWVFT